MTLKHQGDDDEALDYLRTVFALIGEWPGPNKILIEIHEAAGRVATVEKRSNAHPELRRKLKALQTARASADRSRKDDG